MPSPDLISLGSLLGKVSDDNRRANSIKAPSEIKLAQTRTRDYRISDEAGNVLFVVFDLFVLFVLFVVSNLIWTSVRFKELYSRIPALLLSTMKCLILVAILLSVGLAHGYNCPEEGIHFDDDTIDCNMTVESWEDCGMFHDNQSCWHRFGLLSLRHNSYCHLLKFWKEACGFYWRPTYALLSWHHFKRVNSNMLHFQLHENSCGYWSLGTHGNSPNLCQQQQPWWW